MISWLRLTTALLPVSNTLLGNQLPQAGHDALGRVEIFDLSGQEPADFQRVVTRLGFTEVVRLHQKHGQEEMRPMRSAAYIECHEFCRVAHHQPGFFAKFADRRLCRRLPGFGPAAGKGVDMGGRRVFALDQQQASIANENARGGGVRRQWRAFLVRSGPTSYLMVPGNGKRSALDVPLAQCEKQTMCGRFSLISTPEDVREFFSLAELDDFPARYNIAPTQPILVIIAGAAQAKGSNLPERRAMLVRWGLIPSWVSDPKNFPLLINARSETAIGKASFKAAMRHRRILVPASGFYEWYRPPKGSDEKSQAYWMRPQQGGIIAFAGVMETWSSPDGSEVDTAAILTEPANARLSPIHDRMPVVISPEDYARWLDCKTQEPRDIVDLLKSSEQDFFEPIPVADLVNKVANIGSELQTPVPLAVPPKPQTPDEDDSSTAQGSLF